MEQNGHLDRLDSYEAEDVLEEVLSQHSGQQSSFRSSQSRNSLQAENEDGYSDDSPGPEKWSHSILDLLADVDGNRLFTEFLTDHSWQQALYFYLAVNGMKQQTRPNVPHLIYNRWIKPEKMLLPLQLTDTTREKITSTFQPLKPIDLVSHDVFDEAQQEALDFMQQHIHRLFIESEKYLNYVNDYRNQQNAEFEEEGDAEGEGEASDPQIEENDALVENSLPNVERPGQLTYGPPVAPTWQSSHFSAGRVGATVGEDSGVFTCTPQTPQQQLRTVSDHAPAAQQVAKCANLPTTQNHNFFPSPAIHSNGRMPPLPASMSSVSTATGMAVPTGDSKYLARPSASMFSRQQGTGTVAPLTRENLDALSRPAFTWDTSKKADMKDDAASSTNVPYLPRPYVSFLPATAQPTDNDSRVSSSSAGGRRQQISLGRKTNPDELSMPLARDMAGLNVGNKSSLPLPKTAVELRQGREKGADPTFPLRQPDPANPQEFYSKVNEKLASVFFNGMVPSRKPAQPGDVDETDLILKRHVNRITYNQPKTPESIDSPGGGSPVPPTRRGLGGFLAPQTLSGEQSVPRFTQSSSFAPSRGSIRPSLHPPIFGQNGQHNADRGPAGNSAFLTALPNPFGRNGPPKNGQEAFLPPQPPRLSSGTGHMPNGPARVTGSSVYHGDGKSPLAAHPYQTINTVSGESVIGSSTSRDANRTSQRGAAPILRPPLAVSSTNPPESSSAQSHSSRHHGNSNPPGSSRSNSRTTASNRARSTAAALSSDQRRSSRQAPAGVADDATTTVLYRYGNQSQEFFMSKLSGKANLRNFKKTILSEEQRKKDLKFFFKVEMASMPSGYVHEEIFDDNAMLPLFDGRITASISDS